MTALERRGKCLFLVIACLIVLDKLYGVGLALTNNDGQVRWATSVIQPIVLALAVAMLWRGDNRLRLVAAGLCVLSGAERIFVSLRILRVLATAGPDGDSSILGLFGIPVGAVAAVGVLYVVAGLLLAFSPSMREFFRYQRGFDNVRSRIG